MTRLRKMMLEELQRRNYSAITTRNYLRVVADFAKYFGKSPDKLGLNELRTYQAYLLRERKLTSGTVINQVAALRFFFVKTLKRHQFRDFISHTENLKATCDCPRSFKADAQRLSRHQNRKADVIHDRPCDPTKNPLAQGRVTVGAHDE